MASVDISADSTPACPVCGRPADTPSPLCGACDEAAGWAWAVEHDGQTPTVEDQQRSREEWITRAAVHRAMDVEKARAFGSERPSTLAQSTASGGEGLKKEHTHNAD